MIRLSIRRKIMGIAIALIVLMTITAILSMAWVIEVGARLQELTNSYIPAYGSLARTNIRSLERSLALRRSVIEEIQSPSSDKIADIRKEFDAKGVEVEREAQAARALIHDLTEKGETFGNATALARLETRIDSAMADTRRELNAEIERLFGALDTGDAKASADSLQRVDALRDDLNRKLDSIRADMLVIVKAEAAMTVHKQHQAILIAAILTALAAGLGLVFCVGEQWHGPSGPPPSRGRPCDRGGPSRRNPSRHIARRDRPLDHCFEPYGPAVASQGEDARDLRQVCRPAHRRD